MTATRTRPWPEIVAHYASLVRMHASPIEPMLDLVGFLAASPYAAGLFAYTSHDRLCMGRTADFAANDGELQVHYKASTRRFTFAYLQRPGDTDRWSRECAAHEGRATLEHILQRRLRWFQGGPTASVTEPRQQMPRDARDIRWPEVIASALVVVGLGVAALYFHSFQPKAFSPELAEASRRKALANCGYSMFDIDPHAMQCKAFDTIAIDSTPCWGPGCEGYTMTLHANGDAELVGLAPDEAQGTFAGSVDKDDFRRLANLVAWHALDRRGSLGPPAPDAGDVRIRAGCGGTWHVEANQGGEAGEIEGLGVCLEQLRNDISWDRK